MSPHHYWFDSLLWFVTLDKYAKESLGHRSIDESPAQPGFLDRFTPARNRTSVFALRIRNNPLSYPILLGIQLLRDISNHLLLFWIGQYSSRNSIIVECIPHFYFFHFCYREGFKSLKFFIKILLSRRI